MLLSESPQRPEAAARPMVRRLKLSDFRSYAALDLAVNSDLVVLCGENGAGKTNVLEALSLLTAGRGLRRADLEELAREGGSGGFAISAEVDGAMGAVQLGTGVAAMGQEAKQETKQRRYRLDREPLPTARAFADHLRVVWLTPAMDGLFTGSPGERRRFLDRLVLAVDAEHGARVNALERALRNRNRLLEDGTRSGAWLDAAERETAEVAIAVAAARHETISRLAALTEAGRSANALFPWAEIALSGAIESLVAERSALEAEDAYMEILRENRHRDAAAGRTLIGAHTSDLIVRHGPKDIEAARGSTGEQKALLIGLVLAHARLVSSMCGICPIVLLDEVAAHFDPQRREALFAELRTLGAQVWVTGADPGQFVDLNQPGVTADLLHVTPGRIDRA
ncbi:DNA replication/repair protein RecF [Methylocella sp. CPCC 101449]|uniref:DNA replication/repair protein RecF n=1 Tax=Methylocella sp. CPCC 101449 TaxID=2987531 RepID=UPI0028906E4C|nr:DNA replication/repair protein RecF [Methylocella sp. CPCC 101449]MDT2020358.1 DNA replication/repair protein RecF [Methylocella sp. CPCC 101449]